ncbi:hypothetical protein C9374_007631 [Naegleria lovaniensis]|uniref:ATP-dependent DNA helicase n=1 Tax=Naegleria lovaniensis TaxID=51637 RepID=A0AA88GI31_NAELO|nr:uncharacterized protein C9374_007631 [Naegleria lovaniensis]KAG2378993.1 hypothetical protein C9374_007631 [Naegleria lovaniensis]
MKKTSSSKKASSTSGSSSLQQTKLTFKKKGTSNANNEKTTTSNSEQQKNTITISDDVDDIIVDSSDDDIFSFGLDEYSIKNRANGSSSGNNAGNTLSQSSSSSSTSQPSFKPPLKFSQVSSTASKKSEEDVESVDWSNDESITTAMHLALKTKFKLEEFRPNQFEIIFNLLKNRQDTLAVLPTGAGKSLTYQLPAVILPGVTLVVSPLIALMHNQVQALENLNIKANFWNSSQKKSEITKIQHDMEGGNPKYKIIYVTPELLTANQNFQALMRLLASRDQLSLIAIDECHTINSWSDFRKSFRQLGSLKSSFPQVPTIALTATATDKVRTDIVQCLQLRNPKCFITSFNRPNISYEIRYKDIIKDPYGDLCNFLKSRIGECGIIYCRTKNQVEELVSQLSNEKDDDDQALFTVKPYHAGVKLSERKTVLNDWLKGTTKIIVATIAFGMGIDKKDVRFVVHFALPKSLEGFYQESGRAGRDGKKSVSLLYHCSREKSSISFLISRDTKLGADRMQEVEQAFTKVCEFCETGCCRRKFILEYFGESYDPLKPRALTTVQSPVKQQKTSGNTVKQPLKFTSSSNDSRTPSTPPRGGAASSSSTTSANQVEVQQIKGVEYCDKCCDYCANPKKKLEEITNATYTYSSSGSRSGLGTRMADDFIMSASSVCDDFIEEYNSDDLDEFDGSEMEAARQDRDRYRQQKGITNNSLITKNSSSKTKPTSGGGIFKSAADIQQEKRKRMEDSIEDVLDALEREESRERKFSKPSSAPRHSTLLPSRSAGGSSLTSSSAMNSGFVKASSLVTSSNSSSGYRSAEMASRQKTKSKGGNLERFLSKK